MGVAPWAREADLPITGTKLPALLRSEKNLSPASAALVASPPPVTERPAAYTPWIAWLEARGSPASATALRYSAEMRLPQSAGTFLMMSVFTSKASTP